MWSLLPPDVLWTIKDKLDIIDNACLDSVCHTWWLASKGYPKRQTIGNGKPWIIHTSSSTQMLELVSVSGQKKFIMDLPGLCGREIIFSKEGWVLLCQKMFHTSGNVLLYLSLLNPLTGSTIELPPYVIITSQPFDRSKYLASFSIQNGRPHLVVLYFCFDLYKVNLHVAQVGDERWKLYNYMCEKVLIWQQLVGLLVIGNTIYCCYPFGEMVLYNVDSHVWKELADPSRRSFYPRRTCYMEYDGQIILYVQALDDHSRPYIQEYCYSNSDSGDAWERSFSDFNNDKRLANRFISSYLCTTLVWLKTYVSTYLHYHPQDLILGFDHNEIRIGSDYSLTVGIDVPDEVWLRGSDVPYPLSSDAAYADIG